MGFDERANDMCMRARTGVCGIKFFELLFFFPMMMLEYSLVEHGLTYVEIVFDRSFVSHPFLMLAIQTATVGGVHLKFTLVVVGRAYEYSLQ